jgi:hypothetical protein
MFITFELISGMSLGVQFISKSDLGDLEDGWYLILEFLIFRAIIEKVE